MIQPADALRLASHTVTAAALAAVLFFAGAAAAQEPASAPADPYAGEAPITLDEPLPDAPIVDLDESVEPADPAAPNVDPMLPVEGKIVDRIQVVGNSQVTLEFILDKLRTRVGSPYRRTQAEEDVRRLMETNQFDDANIIPQAIIGTDRVIVLVEVTERTGVVSLSFSGNKALSAKSLEEEVNLAVGSSLSEVMLTSAKDAIIRKYRDEGYYYIDVQVNDDAVATGNVVFSITEGPQSRIKMIKFEGNNEPYNDEILRSQIRTAEYFFILNKGNIDPEQIEADANAIRTYYQDQGHLDARVGHRFDFSANREEVTLVFIVEEGIRYQAATISVAGNTAYSTDELMGMVKLQPGDVLLKKHLVASAEAMQNQYRGNGYAFAEVKAATNYAEGDGQVNLVFQIFEGQQYRVGEIKIVGNETSMDKIVRRELHFQPGQMYNEPEIKAAVERLKGTPYFTDASITPREVAPGVQELVVRVAEAETTKFTFGAGVSSNDGLIGSIALENTNFDLYDIPRDIDEMLAGKAFRGAGQYFRIMVEPGLDLFRARLDFRDPYFLDSDVAFGYSAYINQRDRDDYNELRIGQTISFGKDLGVKLLDAPLTGELSFRTEMIKIDDVISWSARDIEDAEGTHFLFSVTPAIVRDTTDSIFFPTEGNRLSLSWEQALFEDMFAKARIQFTQYFTLAKDYLDRKHVLALNAEGGVIVGDAPVYERFYAGGIGSLRGFQYRTISPRAGWRNQKVGGDSEVLLGAEYTFPLIGKEVRGALFTDMGTVSEGFSISDWRALFGVGLRVNAPQVTGAVPLAFNIAFPIMTGEDDETEWFSFSLGLSY